MACIAPLRRGNRSLAAASSSDDRWHDRLLARRRHRHAFQRHAHHRHGVRRGRSGPHAQRTHANSLSNTLARPHSLRFFPRPRRSRQRPCSHHSLRRRHLFLGALHQTLARRLPPLPSRRSCVFLLHRSSLVHSLCTPQPRFLPHLHHRAQFQALPHSRIPTHPALLVLRPTPPHFLCTVFTNFLERTEGSDSQLEISSRLSTNLFLLLGSASSCLFQRLKVKVARVCFAGSFSVDAFVVSFDFGARPRAFSE